MRLLTVTLWVLAGLLLVVAVRSSHRVAAEGAAHGKRERARRVPPLADAVYEGRVGPCWDDVAQQLLHVGADRWLGVGCDVEGARRAGESPECTVLRQRVTACLRRHRRHRDVPAGARARPLPQLEPGWGGCADESPPAGPGPLTPTS